MRFLSTLSLSLVFMSAIAPLHAQTPARDSFGGDKRVVGTKADRFHLEVIAGRHWLVTPDGFGFVAVGVNHIGEAVSSPGRKLTVEETKLRGDAITEQMKSWGYTNFGYGTPTAFCQRMPHIASVSLTRCSHGLSLDKFAYDDVFADEFRQKLDKTISETCKRSAHPTLIGYYWTDTPRWDLDVVRQRRGGDWVSALRGLAADKAGKKRYIQFLRDTYENDTAKFNASYGLGVGKIDDLLVFDFCELDRERKSIKADDQAFLRIIANRLYTDTAESFKKHDPGRLLFGERYKQGDHPDHILAEAAKVVDVISLQPGPEAGPLAGPGEQERTFDAKAMDRIHAITKKPILICDHACSFHTEKHPATLWNQAETEEGSAILAVDFLHAALSKPYIVGYQRCQYIDRFITERGIMKQGLIDVEGKPHEVLVRILAAGNKDLVGVRLRGAPQ